MFERFTERARQVVVLAQEEARALRHNSIGTEHLLLGLLRVEDGPAAEALGALGVRLEEVRDQVARIVGHGEELPHGQIPFTPRAKKVLELALRDAQRRGHDYIGTEHVLLGIVREGKGVAARILQDSGADPDTVRDAVVRALGGRAVVPRPTPRPRGPLRPDATPPPERGSRARLLVLGWLLFTVALGLGVLIGWAIWG